jgi:maltokinase
VITPDELAQLLPDFLVRQRWYGAADKELAKVEVVDFEVVRAEPPELAWAMGQATFTDGSTALYQLPIGVRPLEQTERFLEGKGRSLLGDADTDDGAVLVYDALVDPELAIEFVHHIAPGEQVAHVRSLNVEQSNTSVVYDERVIMKLFRRVPDGPNPDVEVTEGLARVGFEHISAPVASWRKDGRDLAVVRQFLEGGTEGWQLALTSLRDMYDSRLDPADAGGDFAPEARRLGEITANMHVALAEAFGVEDGDAAAWAATMEANLGRSSARHLDAAAISAAYDELRELDDAGKSIRVHGDYHLGQTMRTDSGWYILDFEGEPAAPLEERRAPSSPLRDVAGMLRSFHYAAHVALVERGSESADDDDLRALGARWEEHVAASFLAGYAEVEDVTDLLPKSDHAKSVVLDAFVVAKAVYEVGYELAHRPDWVRIPLEAIARTLG